MSASQGLAQQPSMRWPQRRRAPRAPDQVEAGQWAECAGRLRLEKTRRAGRASQAKAKARDKAASGAGRADLAAGHAGMAGGDAEKEPAGPEDAAGLGEPVDTLRGGLCTAPPTVRGLLARIQAAARAQRVARASRATLPTGLGAADALFLPRGTGTHRDGLVIARSAIPGLDEQGLFTVEAVPPGRFLGVFTGVLVSKEETDKLPKAVRDGVLEWAMAAGNGYSVCPCWPGTVTPAGMGSAGRTAGVTSRGTQVDSRRDPMAYINEPPGGPDPHRANAYVERGYLRRGDVRYCALGVYAGQHGVGAQSEIWLHYGRSYEVHRERKGGYRAGLPSLLPRRHGPNMESVMRRLLDGGERVHDSVFEVPAESSEEEAEDDRAYVASRGQNGQASRCLPIRKSTVGPRRVATVASASGLGWPDLDGSAGPQEDALVAQLAPPSLPARLGAGGAQQTNRGARSDQWLRMHRPSEAHAQPIGGTRSDQQGRILF